MEKRFKIKVTNPVGDIKKCGTWQLGGHSVLKMETSQENIVQLIESGFIVQPDGDEEFEGLVDETPECFGEFNEEHGCDTCGSSKDCLEHSFIAMQDEIVEKYEEIEDPILNEQLEKNDPIPSVGIATPCDCGFAKEICDCQNLKLNKVLDDEIDEDPKDNRGAYQDYEARYDEDPSDNEKDWTLENIENPNDD